MKRAILLLVLMIHLPMYATTIDGWLQIPLTSEVPEIDGEKDAVWNYVGKERMDVYVLDAGSDPGDWLDMWGTFYIMYDATGVYYYFEILDDLLDVSEANTYEQDSIELYWDMDNSKNDVNTGYDDNDFEWRGVLYQTVLEAGTGYAPPDGNVIAFTETDYGYTAEMFVPTADWPVAPEADLEVGFEIHVNDGDNGTREHLLCWYSDTNETWHEPANMGNAVFRGDDYRTISDVLDINYIAGAPIVDGIKEPWWDQLPNVGMNTYVDASGETDIQDMTGPYDLDFSAWQGWNEEGFYLFVSIIDDVLSTANANTYEQDSIELFFDGDNSKNDVSTGYDDNDMQCRFVLNENTLEAGTGWAPTHAVVAWQETDLGADCEILIPASDINHYFPLKFNKTIGYEIQVNDDDGAGTREGMARWWSNSSESWHDPSCFGEARLAQSFGDSASWTNRLEVQSAYVYDFYGGDGMIQPGEFFQIEYQVLNNTPNHYETVYAIADSSYDPYVHPLSTYFFDDYLPVSPSPAPGQLKKSDGLNCYVAWDTPKNYEVAIPLAFYGDGKWVSNDTLRFTTWGSDWHEPFYDYPWISHSTIAVWNQIDFSVKIYEAGTIVNPHADIKNESGDIVATVSLYDQGADGDTLANDRVYYGSWIVPAIGNYSVDISSEDNSGNIGKESDYFSFVCVETSQPVFDRVASTGNSQVFILQSANIAGDNLVPGDMIGVFDDTLCVGTALYQGSYPLSFVVVNEAVLPEGGALPGAVSGNPISYKIYDSRRGRVLQAGAVYEEGSGVFGQVLTVLKSLSGVNQKIELKSNQFDWISLNYQPDDPHVAAIFNSMETLEVVLDDKGNHYVPKYQVDTIDEINAGKGYMVFGADFRQDLMITGSPLDPTQISLNLDASQMHLIGYPYSSTHSATEVFESIAESIVLLQSDAGQYWIPQYNYNSLASLSPGEAYQIYLKENVNFTFPELTSGLSKRRAPFLIQQDPVHFTFIQTGLPQAIVVTGSESLLEIGDELGVFDGDLCVGAGVFEGDFPLVLTAWEGYDDYELEGFQQGNSILLKVWQQSSNEELFLTGTFESDAAALFKRSALVVTHLNSFDQSYSISHMGIPQSYRLEQNYPNPFNPSTQIRYQLPEAADVKLSVFNTIGQKIIILVDSRQSAGFYEVEWHGRNECGARVESGLYLLVMESQKNRFSRKMVFIE